MNTLSYSPIYMGMMPEQYCQQYMQTKRWNKEGNVYAAADSPLYKMGCYGYFICRTCLTKRLDKQLEAHPGNSIIHCAWEKCRKPANFLGQCHVTGMNM